LGWSLADSTDRHLDNQSAVHLVVAKVLSWVSCWAPHSECSTADSTVLMKVVWTAPPTGLLTVSTRGYPKEALMADWWGLQKENQREYTTVGW
jgi:hypothetical protein